MNPKGSLERQKNVLERLSSLPRKILSLHGGANSTDLVLHELCHEQCFNIDKAAYFIDNPDFDCLRGIAGYCKHEVEVSESDIWQDPEIFTTRAHETPFNRTVRQIMQESGVRRKKNEHEVMSTIAQQLNFSRHGLYFWQMKHDNHGIFIYERAIDFDSDYDKFLPEGITLLSFCPIL